MKRIKISTSMAIGLLASLTGIAAAPSAYANHPTNADNFTKNYGSAGNWNIVHGDGDTCVADTDNGQVQLRIIYTEYTGDMLIGMPYYGHQNSVTGDYGFGRINISANFETSIINSWAMTHVDQRFQNQLLSGSQIGFFLDRGQQMFSLRGSSAAIAMLRECARNNGVRRNNQVTQNNNNYPVQPAPLPPANNPTTPRGDERHYAAVRGWSVDAIYTNGTFLYCGATNSSRYSRMRVGYDGRNWQIGMETTQRGNDRGELHIEVNNGQIIHGGQVTYDHGNDGWATTDLSYQFVSYLKQGNKVSMDIGQGFQNFTLSGSTAALLKAEECARNGGVKPIRQVTRPNNVRPTNNQNNQTLNQPHKNVLRGTWIWTNRQKNAEQNSVISTIEMTSDTTARYCYGFPCWDVQLTKNANNTISFSHDGVAYFEFFETGQNAIAGSFWEDRNNLGRADATVNMR